MVQKASSALFWRRLIIKYPVSPLSRMGPSQPSNLLLDVSLQGAVVLRATSCSDGWLIWMLCSESAWSSHTQISPWFSPLSSSFSLSCIHPTDISQSSTVTWVADWQRGTCQPGSLPSKRLLHVGRQITTKLNYVGQQFCEAEIQGAMGSSLREN